MIANARRPNEFRVLLIGSLISSLIMLDSNIVAVSLPAIGQSLNASFVDLQWVISAYVLTYAALLLAAGSYADLRGRRKAMITGLVIFAVSSAGCGVAPNVSILNIARAIQGVGGAFLLTASLAIITHQFTGDARSRAFAFWGASLGIALTAGPVLGGGITHFLGWRWIFLVNVPVSLALIAATLMHVEESVDPQAKGMDVLGIVTFSAGLALLVWALIAGNDEGWTSTTTVLRFTISMALFTAFVIVELRSHHPMVDLALFRNPTFIGAVIAMIGYGASAQVMIFLLPQFLQNAYDYGPLTAGAAMLPFALPMVLVPRLSAPLELKFSGRALLSFGLLISFAGNLMFWATARALGTYWLFLIGMIVAGSGAGLMNGQTVKVLQGAVPANRPGMGSGIASTTRFIGILVSVAGMGAVLANIVRRDFVAAATADGLSRTSAEFAARQVTAGDLQNAVALAPPHLRTTLHGAGLSAFSHGFAAAGLIAAVIAAVAGVLTYLFVRAEDTAPRKSAPQEAPCKLLDCRHPV